jgi:hypothetical protein
LVLALAVVGVVPLLLAPAFLTRPFLTPALLT